MDTEQRNRLVEQFLPACRSMAGVWLRHAKHAGLGSITGEELYSEAYTYLLEFIIPSYDPMRNVPLQQWVNLKLRARLSDYLRKQTKLDGRELVGDLDPWTEIESDPDDNPHIPRRSSSHAHHLAATQGQLQTEHPYTDRAMPGDLAKLLIAAKEQGVITETQMGMLSLIGCGRTVTDAGKAHGLSSSTAWDQVERAKRDIGREVLGLAD